MDPDDGYSSSNSPYLQKNAFPNNNILIFGESCESLTSSQASERDKTIRNFLENPGTKDDVELMAASRLNKPLRPSTKDKCISTDPCSTYRRRKQISDDSTGEALIHYDSSKYQGTAEPSTAIVQLNQFDADDEEEWVARRRKVFKGGSRIFGFIEWFLTHSRTERAFKTTLFLIPALLITYNKWLGPNLPYSCILLYVLMSALLPPLVSGVSVVAMMSFPAALLGTSMVTAIWAAGTVDWWLSKDWSMFLVMMGCVICISTWKIGKLSALTGMAALMAVYSSELPFFIGFPFVKEGISLSVPTDPIIHDMKAHNPFTLPPADQAVFTMVWDNIVEELEDALASGTFGHFKLIVPPWVTDFDADYKPMIGRPVHLDFFKEKTAHISIPSGLWLVRLAWNGHGKLGLIRAILEYGFVALGLFACSVLFPPQRYARSYLRERISKVTREAGTLLQLIGEQAALVTDAQKNKMIGGSFGGPSTIVRVCEISPSRNELPGAVKFSFTNMGAPSGTRNYRAVVDSEDNTFQHASTVSLPKSVERPELNKKISYMGLRHSSMVLPPSMSVSGKVGKPIALFPSNRSTSAVFPSVDETAETTHRVLDYQQPSWHFEAEEMEDTIRQAILSISELIPFIGASSFEPSLSNPGITVSYFLRWTPVFDSLRRVFVHQNAFWDLIKPPLRDDAGPDDLWPYLPQQHPAAAIVNLEKLRDPSSPSRRTTDLSIETILFMADIISLRPVSRGAQVDTIKRLKDELRSKVRRLVGLRDELSLSITFNTEHNHQHSELPLLPSKQHDWKTAVSIHAALLEFSQATVEAPLQLAVAVDRLVSDQSLRRIPRGILLSIFGFMMPLVVLVAFLLKGVVHLLMPWSWRWRMPHPKYLGTGLPWFRSTDVLYCYRWAIGVIALFGIPIFSERFRTWYLTGQHEGSGLLTYLDLEMTSKMASWTSLGFLTTMFLTVEGTTHRAGLRVLGVISGTLCAYLCLLILGTDNKVGHMIWLSVTIFIVCWIGGNPQTAVLGYHPSWGYACQLFTYQEAIIVVESYFSIQSRDELVASRLMGQLIGISTALFLTYVFFPDNANATIEQCSVQVLYCTGQSIIALTESLMLSSDIKSETFHENDSDVNDEYNNNNNEKRGSVETNAGSTTKSVRSLPPLISAPRTWDKKEWGPHKSLRERMKGFCKHRKGANITNDNDYELRLKLEHERLKQRAVGYFNDAKAALDQIAAHMKDLAIFKEWACFRLDSRLQDSLIHLQFMVFHLEAFLDLDDLTALPSLSAISQTELHNVLKALASLATCLEHVVSYNVTCWYPGYRVYTRWIYSKFCAKRFKQNNQKHETKLRQKLREHTQHVNTAFEALGAKYSTVLAFAYNSPLKNQKIVGGDDVLSNGITSNRVLGMPLDLWVWLTTVHVLLRYSKDLRNYMATRFRSQSEKINKNETKNNAVNDKKLFGKDQMIGTSFEE